ncbi:MAG: diguanylate cyclase domain-containing protein [Magnetospiraceae bacterium]
MHRLANVIVAGSESPLVDHVINALAENNFNALAYESAEDVLVEAVAAQPDLVLIEEGPGFDGFALARKLRDGSFGTSLPVVMFTETGNRDTFFTKALEAGVDDAFFAPIEPSEVVHRLRPLLRVSTMRWELQRRATLAESFGANGEVSEATEAESEPRVLVLYGDEARAAAINDWLGGRAVVAVDSSFEAEDMVTEQIFDAVVAYAETQAESVLGFCAQIRNNPRLFNLPVIVVSEDETLGSRQFAHQRGATRVVAPANNAAELRYAVESLIHRQRLRWDLRNALEALRQAALLDVKSGQFSRPFFEAHLTMLLQVAETWQKHLTLVVFSVPSIIGIRERFGDDAANDLIRQIGSWIRGLSRVEDLVAAFSEDEFCVTLPDTPAEEAQAVMNRIAGIISYTDFAVAEVYQPINVTVEVGLTGMQVFDDTENLIARAREIVG